MKRVLILDDDKRTISLLKCDLSPLSLEIKVLEAKNVEEALSILGEGVDVAFIDRYLHDEDAGVNFIKENANKFKNVSFYLHSSKKDDEATNEIIKSGGKGFINKRESNPVDYARAIGFSEEKLKSLGYIRG